MAAAGVATVVATATGSVDVVAPGRDLAESYKGPSKVSSRWPVGKIDAVVVVVVVGLEH